MATHAQVRTPWSLIDLSLDDLKRSSYTSSEEDLEGLASPNRVFEGNYELYEWPEHLQLPAREIEDLCIGSDLHPSSSLIKSKSESAVWNIDFDSAPSAESLPFHTEWHLPDLEANDERLGGLDSRHRQGGTFAVAARLSLRQHGALGGRKISSPTIATVVGLVRDLTDLAFQPSQILASDQAANSTLSLEDEITQSLIQLVQELQLLLDELGDSNDSTDEVSLMNMVLKHLRHFRSPLAYLVLEIASQVARPAALMSLDKIGLGASQHNAELSLLSSFHGLEAIAAQDTTQLLTAEAAECMTAVEHQLEVLKEINPMHPLLHARNDSCSADLSEYSAVHPDAILGLARKHEEAIMAALGAMKEDHDQDDAAWDGAVRRKAPQTSDNFPNDDDGTSKDTVNRGLLDAARMEFGTLSDRASLQLGKRWPNRPLLEIYKPLVDLQTKLLTGAVLRGFIRDLSLDTELARINESFLLGNCAFLSRLQMLLFDRRSTSSAQIPSRALLAQARKSEPWEADLSLRLALSNLISDCFDNKGDIGHSPVKATSSLSFALHKDQLPPTSITDPFVPGIFDFLHLRYSPPAGMGHILSSEVLQEYDSIFAFLLRVARQSSVVKTLAQQAHALPRSSARFDHRPIRTSSAYSVDSARSALRFSYLAHHTISILTSFIPLALSPWNVLQSDLSFLSTTLDDEDKMGECGAYVQTTLSDLCSLHEDTLQQIMFRLFLTSDTEAVASALQSTFETVLNGAAVVDAGRNGVVPAQAERLVELENNLRVGVKELVILLRQRVRDLPATKQALIAGGADADEGDDAADVEDGKEISEEEYCFLLAEALETSSRA